MDGPLGHLADGLSVVAAIAGTVGAGFLSLQLSNAAGQLPWLSDSAGLQILVVVLLTAVFMTSTVSGIQKGIKWLSELNVWLTLVLAAGLLLLGRLADAALLRRFHHLPDPPAADGPHSQCRAGELGERLDGVLLGLVPRLCALDGAVHRRCQPRPQHP